MQRPTVLLAGGGELEASAPRLEAAGFAVLLAKTEDDARVALRQSAGLDLAVIDSERDPAQAEAIYGLLHAPRAIPTLLLVPSVAPSGGPGAGGGSFPSDEYAIKPVEGESLVYRLQAMLIRLGRELPSESGSWASSESLNQAPVAGEGHVINVFAPKGGVGKTTIAVNLAVALREQTRSRVLLFDADVGVGNVTAVLDVPFRVGLSDLANEEWTDEAFEQAVCVHADSGVRVLTWGVDPAESERVTVDLLLAALKWARRHHSYVIIDNHPGYADRTLAMLTVADEVFLVVTPEVGSVKNSSQFLDLARQLGLGDVVRVVVNRANHGIRIADLASSLKAPVAATIVSSGPRAVIAANEGRPIISKFPKERISRDLHDIARLVTQRGGVVKPERRRWRLPWHGRPATSATGR